MVRVVKVVKFKKEQVLMKNKIVYLLLHSISCLVHADLRDTINLLLPTSQNSDVNNKAVFIQLMSILESKLAV